MSTLAVDPQHIYRVVDGGIHRALRAVPGDPFTAIAGPDADVAQLACTDHRLFALDTAGRVHERLSVRDGTWSLAADGTYSSITPSATYLHLLDVNVFRRLLRAGDVALDIRPAHRDRIVQIDHDEDQLLALTADGRILFRRSTGGWSEYIPSLGGVVEIAASRAHIFARLERGEVYRTLVPGRSGWSALGINDAASIAVSSDHEEAVYVEHGDGEIKRHGIFDFLGESVDYGWVERGAWVVEGYVTTGTV